MVFIFNLTQDPWFPSSRFPVWCGKGRKKRELVLLFLSLSAFACFALVFLALTRSFCFALACAKAEKSAGAHLSFKIHLIFLGVGGCTKYDLSIVLYVGFEQSSHHSLVRYFVTVSNGR